MILILLQKLNQTWWISAQQFLNVWKFCYLLARKFSTLSRAYSIKNPPMALSTEFGPRRKWWLTQRQSICRIVVKLHHSGFLVFRLFFFKFRPIFWGFKAISENNMDEFIMTRLYLWKKSKHDISLPSPLHDVKEFTSVMLFLAVIKTAQLHQKTTLKFGHDKN